MKNRQLNSLKLNKKKISVFYIRSGKPEYLPELTIISYEEECLASDADCEV
ncbi:hypothetical protein [Kordia jejudonensis]|uniref:hypothetical protein n=1 Tax=Kordia jejudonensis TaxID=1348245 RepID=UPI0012E0800B|nr:hypothetical protein [Kordia jejudonensis]